MVGKEKKEMKKKKEEKTRGKMEKRKEWRKKLNLTKPFSSSSASAMRGFRLSYSFASWSVQSRWPSCDRPSTR